MIYAARVRPQANDSLRHAVFGVLFGFTLALIVVFSTQARASLRVSDHSSPQPPALPIAALPSVSPAPTSSLEPVAPNISPSTLLSPLEESAIVARARLEIARVNVYDNTWMLTSSYPLGDVPKNRGACTDVVVRALREVGVDLQPLVHDDVARDMHAYGVSLVDAHIDHRRVSTMYTYFARNALSLTRDLREKDAWRPGDVVFVTPRPAARSAPPTHVAILSDKLGPRGMPLLIENGGPRAVEHDSLGRGKVVGHFRALLRP